MTWILVPTLLLVIGVFEDLRSRKIPNQLNLLFLLVGLANQSFWFGFNGLGQAALGAVAAFGLAIPFYLLRIFGGGDFKLLVVLGTFTGIGYLVPTMGLILVWGGIFALVHSLTSGRISHVASNVVSVILVRKPLPDPLLHRIPFTLPILFGWLSLLSLLNLGVLT